MNYPSLALDSRRDVLHVTWSEAERFPGFIAYCSFDVSGDEPVLRDPPRVISGAEHRACVCISPALAVDAEGVVHAAWEAVKMTPGGERPTAAALPGEHGWFGDIAYANSRGGWGEVTLLRTLQGNGVAPTMGVDGRGWIHVLWEAGLYRRSTDGGRTWDPPLDQPPRRLFPELAEGDRRVRYCAIAASPRSERVFAVAAAEDVYRAESGRVRWTGPLNVHTLWARELIGDDVGALELIRSLPGRRVSSAESRDDPDGVRFLSLPATSLSGDGALAVVWEETRVIGDRKQIESRFAVRDPEGVWGPSHAIGELPDTATVSAFPAPEFADALDVVWTEAEHYDWRDILGNDVKRELPFISYLHVLFYSRYALTGEDLRAPVGASSKASLDTGSLPSWSELEARVGRKEGARCGASAMGGSFSWVDAGLPGADAAEAPPSRGIIALVRSSARAPTATATPTGTPTPDPTWAPSPTPEGTRVELPVVADTYVDRDSPYARFGGLERLSLWTYGSHKKWAFLRCSLEGLPPNADLVSAVLAAKVVRATSSPRLVHVYRVVEPWEESQVSWRDQPVSEDLGLPADLYPPARYWGHSDVRPLVAMWLSGAPNYGLALRMEELPYTMGLASREWPDSGERPRIIVYYVLKPTATPTVTPTPVTPTPQATFTPSPRPEIALRAEVTVNQGMFHAGDRQVVEGLIENLGVEVTFTEVVVLEYYGAFFFWPEWTPAVQGREEHLAPHESLEVTILDFVWPAIGQPVSNARIWHAAISPTFAELYSNLSYCEFSAE